MERLNKEMLRDLRFLLSIIGSISTSSLEEEKRYSQIKEKYKLKEKE